MKILILGGSGFIGTNLIEYYIKNTDYSVRNFDILPPRNKSHIDYWEMGDITNYSLIEKLILSFSPDYIIHLAARTDILGKTINDYQANTIGVENVLNISKKLPKLRKVIFTSSMLVCRVGYKQAHIFDYSPPNAYGESKIRTEKIILEDPPIVDWAILRPTSIWGEWFDTYKDFFMKVMTGKYFHIGQSSCTKTYGYVGNVVYQIDMILHTKTNFEDGNIFYLGDLPAYNIEDWANEIAGICNRKVFRLPICILKIAALFGDFLKIWKINFPMTSFRLKNMTTNNVIDVSSTYKIAPNPPFTRSVAIKKTIEWIKNYEMFSHHRNL